ncbi:MAG: hypothetical protein JJ920_15055 [Roseitalea sp.]|jgi:hypothetical protein|nr:hypothetical protein [Roseitalea sp.]MBO6721173.1 hypothetical protein [Roseitalea sp.]MBO6744231.1 hypothetical protein [Roseitalea sp.]
MNRTITTLLVAIMMLPLPAWADGEHTHGPYAGFEAREIKSLSQEDLDELRRGGGWGLALSAELSGRPGPAHLLELRDELGLSDAQVTSISTIRYAMRADAIAAGERFIAAEAALSAAFADPDLAADDLRALVDAAAATRADLRFVHLSRHLSTPQLLTADQIERYAVLRGYSDDRCAEVPDGHDATLWRRHNGCD